MIFIDEGHAVKSMVEHTELELNSILGRWLDCQSIFNLI